MPLHSKNVYGLVERIKKTPKKNGFLSASLVVVGGVTFAFVTLGQSGCQSRTPSQMVSTSNTTVLPGPAPQARLATFNPVTENEKCEKCHAAIAVEWRESYHKLAHIDPVYQRAFAIEPLPFCQGCHAPEADPSQAVPQALGELGVGCVTCHNPTQSVIAAGLMQKSSASETPRSSPPHPVEHVTEFGRAGGCSNCHQFPFPDANIRHGIELMQSTINEHALSADRDTNCVDCHMPIIRDSLGGASHRSHRFDASRDPEFLRRSVWAQAQRLSPTSVQIQVRVVKAGHAVPTGDLFRRLEVMAEAQGPEMSIAASSHHYLMRHFKDQRMSQGPAIRVVAYDDRPIGEPVIVPLELGEAAAGKPIVWRLSYQRVEHPRSEREEDSLVEGEIILAQGVVP